MESLTSKERFNHSEMSEDDILQFVTSQPNLDEVLQVLSRKECDLEILLSTIGICYPCKDDSDVSTGKLELLFRKIYAQRAFVIEASINAIHNAMYHKNDISLLGFLTNFVRMIKGILRFSNLTSGEIAKLLSYLKLTARKFQRLKLKSVDLTQGENECLERLTKLRKYEKSVVKEKKVNDFRSLSILPSLDDIFNESPIPLQPNIIYGPYQSVEQYLDLHFRLMREDMLQSFRSGLKTFREKLSMEKVDVDYGLLFTNVRVTYPPNFSIDGVLYILVIRSLSINWNTKKCLKPGSLICLSCDQFVSVVFATIKDKIINSEHEVKIKIIVENIGEELLYKMPYALLQIDIHFETYKHILQKMTYFREDNFPLADCIVKLDFRATKTNPFANKIICLHEKCNQSERKRHEDLKCQCRRFDPEDLKEWPLPDELHMDGSQLAALRLALLNKLALIQGPPGTGKTYMAVKIVKALLENGVKKPIIICCNTNHALDQFLTQLLRYTDKLIRIGNQGQHEGLQPYTLSVMWDAIKCFFNFDMSHTMSDLGNKALEIAKNICPDILSKPVKCSFKGTKESLGGLCFEINELYESYISCKFFYFKEKVLNKIIEPKYKKKFLEGSVGGSKLLTMCIVEWLTLPKNDFYTTCDKIWKEQKRDRRQNSASKIITDMTEEEEEANDFNVWKISVDERFALVYKWRKRELKKLHKLIKENKQLYFKTLEKRRRPIFKDMIRILQHAEIIGMTTCGSAKFKDILLKTSPKILIIEEAAEIFESHVITALCPSIEHIILMGDHKQLQPRGGSREFASKYKLSVSMFERLLNNGAPSVTLKTQRRMRPLVASLLVPEIYRDLDSHPSVNKYENVSGVVKNVFFLKHAEAEKSMLSLKFLSNDFEAKFIAILCEYLLLQGYSQSRITILSTYQGQLPLILSYIKFPMNGLRVTTVDDYQGEENDIILLSLVRSNSEGNIGFLMKSNRICVALSRAKIGFYCVGNFDMFARHHKLWASVIKKLELNNAIGEKFPLKCHNHVDTIQYVSTAEEFKHYIITGCGNSCNYILPCNHECSRDCHYDDLRHEIYKCKKPCDRTFGTNGNALRCQKYCWENCCTDKKITVKLPCQHTIKINRKMDIDKFNSTYKCSKETEKLLPCGHFCEMPCHVDVKFYSCPAIQHINLSCGHRNSVRCYQTRDRAALIPCKGSVTRTSPCGHTVTVPCYFQRNRDILVDHCQRICDELLACGHSCIGLCRTCKKLGIHELCIEKCDRKLACGHQCEDLCNMQCSPCTKPCEMRCCHLKCPNPCFRPCVICREPCDRSCKHKRCQKLCGEVCQPCTEPCELILKCGHPCIGFCGEPCPDLCRICDVDQLLSEQPDTDRFIKLEDCNHTVEAKKLKSVVKKNISCQHWPACPLCSTPIRKHVHLDSDLKFAKLQILDISVGALEIIQIKNLLYSVFPQSGIVCWKFWNIHNKMADILDSQRHTPGSLNILRNCLLALKILVDIEKKLKEDLQELKDLLLWIENHLQRASLQQIYELHNAVKNIAKKLNHDFNPLI